MKNRVSRLKNQTRTTFLSVRTTFDAVSTAFLVGCTMFGVVRVLFLVGCAVFHTKKCRCATERLLSCGATECER